MSIEEPMNDTLDSSAWTLATWLKLGLVPFALSAGISGNEFLSGGSVDLSGSEGTNSVMIVETGVTEWDLAHALAGIHGDLTRNATRADAELGEVIDKHLFELYVQS